MDTYERLIARPRRLFMNKERVQRYRRNKKEASEECTNSSNSETLTATADEGKSNGEENTTPRVYLRYEQDGNDRLEDTAESEYRQTGGEDARDLVRNMSSMLEMGSVRSSTSSSRIDFATPSHATTPPPNEQGAGEGEGGGEREGEMDAMQDPGLIWRHDPWRLNHGDDKEFFARFGKKITSLVCTGGVTKAAAQKILELCYESAEDLARVKRRGSCKKSSKWLIRKTILQSCPEIRTKLYRLDETGKQEEWVNVQVLSREFQTPTVVKRVTSIRLREIIRHVYQVHNVDQDNPPDEWRMVEVGSDGFTPTNKGSWGYHKVSVKFLKCGKPYPLFLHQFNSTSGGSVDCESVMRPVVDELLQNQDRVTLVRIVGDGKERKMQKGMMATNSTMGCELCKARGINVAGDRKKKRKSFPSSVEVDERRSTAELKLELEGLVDEETGKLLEPIDGVLYWSPFLDLPGFQMVESGPFDSMHLFAYGLTKKIFKLIFMSSQHKDDRGKGKGKGKSNDKKRRKRRESILRMKEQGLAIQSLLRWLPLPREFGRRARSFDFSDAKSSEWRMLGLYLFCYVASSKIMDKGNLLCRQIVFLLNYLYRLVNVDDATYFSLGEAHLRHVAKTFQEVYTEQFGEGESTFNEHCCFAHIAETRSSHGPMHQYSVWRYEDTIARILKSYKSGSPHEGRQVFENMYTADKHRHLCPSKKQLRISPQTKSRKQDDSLIYTSRGFFRVIKRGEAKGTWFCQQLKTKKFSTRKFQLPELEWKAVGIELLAKTGNGKEDLELVRRTDVLGKALLVRGMLITCPKEWLFE